MRKPAEVSIIAPHTELLEAARAVRLRTVETIDGPILTGCNVESATYGLTVCAECVAMFKAISEGHRQFTRIAVVADTAEPTPPCGARRQILWEMGGDLEVILGNLREEKARYRMKDLLPLPFDARLL